MTTLSRAALVEFRDALHADSFIFAGTTQDVMSWDAQLADAVERGELDARPGWELQAEADARRVAQLVVAELRPLLRHLPHQRPLPEVSAPEWIDASEAVRRKFFGSKRAFNTACTRGEFPSAVRNGRRERIARLADVEAWLSQRAAPRARSQPAGSVDDAIRAALERGRLRALPGGRK